MRSKKPRNCESTRRGLPESDGCYNNQQISISLHQKCCGNKRQEVLLSSAKVRFTLETLCSLIICHSKYARISKSWPRNSTVFMISSIKFYYLRLIALKHFGGECIGETANVYSSSKAFSFGYSDPFVACFTCKDAKECDDQKVAVKLMIVAYISKKAPTTRLRTEN